MNNSFSLLQIQKTSNLYPKSKSRQYKRILMTDFVRKKYENSKLKQSELTNQLGYPSSTLQRYKNDIKKLSPYRIHTNTINRR